MLGQARLAGSRVDGAGFAAGKAGLHATLHSAGKKGAVTLWAHIRDAAGKAKTSKGLLRPAVKKGGGAGRVVAKAPKSGTCPVVPGPTAIRPELPPLAILKGAPIAPAAGATGSLTVTGKAACLAATPVDKGGRAWAWLRGPRGPALHALQCGKTAAATKAQKPAAKR
jgi:hypothetical protein